MITLKDLNPPSIVYYNTMLWDIPQDKEEFLELHLKRVEKWLKRISEKFNINLIIDRNKYRVMARYNDKTVFYLHLFISDKIYKKIRSREFLKLLSEKE